MTQGTRIEVEEGDSQPLLVKTATTDIGRTLLAQEAQRLTRAAHPRVVELLSHDRDRLVLAWAGGQTLALARPPVTVAAAILAAVASTVADLHEVGIVHGRLDPSHVLLGVDGRPRLCGLCGPVPGSADPTAADDVAAIGALINELVGPEAELEPIPERRWGKRRWSGYQRRALQTLADQATHDDPACRPTARTLAAAIATAIPEARVQPADPQTASGVRSTPSCIPVAAPPVDHPVPGLRSSAEPVPVDQPVDGPAGEAPDAGEARGPLVDAAGHDHGDPSDLQPADRPGPWVAPPAAELTYPAPDGSPSVPVATVLGLRVEQSAAEGSDDAKGRDDAERDAGHDPGYRRRFLRAAAHEAGTPRRTRRVDRGRRAFEPASAAPAKRRPPVLAGAAALLALVALTGWLRPTTDAPAQPARVAGAPAVDVATSVAEPPEAATASLGATGATGATGTTPVPVDDTATDPRCAADPPGGPDGDGDGCPDEIVVSGTSIRTAGITYSVGQAGDRVAVGDWDCDGTATPGIVRPGTGEVFLFDDWAASDQAVTVEAAAVVPGARTLTPAPARGPCPEPSVVLEDRTTRAIPTPRQNP